MSDQRSGEQRNLGTKGTGLDDDRGTRGKPVTSSDERE
jgi:hypothetical protein